MVSVRNIASSQPLIRWPQILERNDLIWFALLAGINWLLPENAWTQGTSLHPARWKQHHIRTLWMSKVNILHSPRGWCEKSTGPSNHFGYVTPQKWPQQALQLKEAPSHHDSDTQSLSLEVEGKQCLAGTFALWLCRRDDFFLSKLYVLLQGSTKALHLWQRQAMLRLWSKSLSGADSWLYHLPSQTRNAATEHINDQIKWPDQLKSVWSAASNPRALAVQPMWDFRCRFKLALGTYSKSHEENATRHDQWC